MAGNAGDDTVVGGENADRVLGGTGADQVVGGPGHDWVQGGPGNDWRVVDTSTGTDELYGNAGIDTIDATNRQTASQPDFVDGGDGFDTCYVNEQDEVVNCEEVFVLQP